MKSENALQLHLTLDATPRLLKAVATVVKHACKTTLHLTQHRITIPASLGEGYIECRTLQNGLACVVSELTFRKPTFIHSELQHDRSTHYSACCIIGSTHSQVYYADDAQKPRESTGDCTFMRSSHAGIRIFYPAGVRVRTFSVIVTRQYLLDGLKYAGYPPEHPFYTSYMHNMPVGVMLPLGLASNTTSIKAFECVNDATPDYIKRLTLLSLCYSLLANWYTQELSAKAPRQDKPADVGIQDILAIKKVYVRNFEAPPLSVDELARMCNMSVTKFKRLFKATCGMSCYQYYQSQRMEHARQLLSQGYSIKEVAYMTGFQHTANFTRCFKKEFGKLPKAYMKEWKQD